MNAIKCFMLFRIEEVLNDLSWKPTKDRYDDGYRLKWCELKTTINYNTFKEGSLQYNISTISCFHVVYQTFIQAVGRE